MLIPYLFGTLLIVAVPALIAILTSFTQTDMLTPTIFTGLMNYTIIQTYPPFWAALQNTVGFIVIAVPIRILTMLAVSLALNRIRRGVRFARIMVYMPMVIPDAAYALIWSWIFNPLFGPVNMLLTSLGLPAPQWLADRNTVGFVLLIMSLFQIGEGLIVLLAGLHEIPTEYYDSSAVDGATGWQQFRFITLPLLRPWLFVLTLRDITFGAQAVFTPAYILIGGGRDFAQWYMPQMIYEEAFSQIRFGVASVVVVIWLAVGIGLFYLAFRLLKGWGYTDEI
jgi:multiple sugar transport system permease protein